MRIAILSDIHDRLELLEEGLKKVQDCEALICCGDLCSPFTAKALGEGFSGPVYVVFGNNDGDVWRISANAIKRPNLHFLGELGEVELGGKKFAIHHFDNVGRALAMSGQYDVVCCGHSHRYEVTRVGKTLLINPGEIYGRLTGLSSLAVYDTSLDRVEQIVLADFRNRRK